jgi:2'-5' RNA ligase
MYRLFVAIDLPESVKNSISSICCGLQEAKWVNIKQLHLTLRFIGEVDDRVFLKIKESLSGISEAPFSLTLGGVGCFPPRRPPRVLWIGIEKCDTLLSLAAKIEHTLVEKCGIEPEGRAFSPHITIARFRETKPAGVSEYVTRHQSFHTESFPVDVFHLYSSTLTPAGAEHRRECSYPLLGK